MAWPQSTRFLDFIDDSTPYVSAAFLNAVQDEVIRLTGKRRVRLEDWLFPGGGPFTGILPNGLWRADFNHSGSAALNGPVTGLPWANLRLIPDGGFVDSYVSINCFQGLQPDAVHTLIFEGWMERAVLGLSSRFYFGFGDTVPALGTQYALITGAPGAFWQTQSFAAGPQQSTTTAITYPADAVTRVRLRVEVDVAAVRFYINDALVATHTTQVPTVALRAFEQLSYTGGGETATVRLGPCALGYSLI